MKKTVAIILALTLAGAMSFGAMAEGDGGFFDWVSKGWSSITETVEDAWNRLVSEVTDLVGEIEDYITQTDWSDELQSAWDTIKQGASDIGSVAKEDLDAAYDKLSEWVKSKGDDVDAGISEALDKVAEVAGVVKAQLSVWLSEAESYITSNYDSIEQTVLDAWDTVKQGALDAGSVAQEKLSEAKQTISDWLKTQNLEEDSEIKAAFDGILAE